MRHFSFFLTVMLLSLSMTTPATAATGGIGIMILIESGRTLISPDSAAALDACLGSDGEAWLQLEDGELRCPDPVDGPGLACARDGGLCVIENVDKRLAGGCDTATGLGIVDLTLEGMRVVELGALEWSTNPAATRCQSPTGLCGNFNDDDEEDLRTLTDVVHTCKDSDGDSAADIVTLGGSTYCGNRSDEPGETVRALIMMPCDSLGLEIAIDSLRGAQTATYLQTEAGERGLELRIAP